MELYRLIVVIMLLPFLCVSTVSLDRVGRNEQGVLREEEQHLLLYG